MLLDEDPLSDVEAGYFDKLLHLTLKDFALVRKYFSRAEVTQCKEKLICPQFAHKLMGVIVNVTICLKKLYV